jgi:mono/diheme cytochrome c family protein
MNRIQGDGVKDGGSLYQMYCIACHTTGKTSFYDEIFRRTVPAIMNPAFSKAADDGLLKKIIEEGRKDTQMTAWKSDAAGLSEEEIQTLINYITKNRPHERPESFGMSKYKGDKGYGEVIYNLRCLICHGAEGKGGENLLGISLKNPIVQKEATPEFIAITVRDGREGTPMVGFGEKGLGLENKDIADVVAYVRTLSQKN